MPLLRCKIVVHFACFLLYFAVFFPFFGSFLLYFAIYLLYFASFKIGLLLRGCFPFIWKMAKVDCFQRGCFSGGSCFVPAINSHAFNRLVFYLCAFLLS